MVTYTTSDNVAGLLQVSNFSTTTMPTKATVEKYIERAESKVESRTGHAWKATTISNEYIDPSSKYRYGTGIRFKLNNRSIRSLAKLEIFDGTNWVDYVDTKIEGRDNDYWVNYEEGVVYIIGLRKVFPDGIRVSYIFGELTVSGGIEEATTMMAAIMIMNSPEYNTAVFSDDGGSSRINDNNRIEFWSEEVSDILANNAEFKSI
jgi:hypothetical protein